jgi:hypothetical protein
VFSSIWSLIGAAVGLLRSRSRRFSSERMLALVFTERTLHRVLDLMLHVAVVLAFVVPNDPLDIRGTGGMVT